MRRRDIIRNCALVGAGAMLPVPGALAATHKSVAGGLRAYSDRIHTKPGAGSTVHIVASIDDMAAFADPDVRLRALPYGGITAEGNTLSFRHKGTEYRVENVLPHDFDRAVASA